MLKSRDKADSQTESADVFIKAGPDAMSSQGIVKNKPQAVDTKDDDGLDVSESNNPDLPKGQQTASHIAPRKYEHAEKALEPQKENVMKAEVCSKYEDNQPTELERGIHKQIDQQKIDEDLLNH